MTPGATTRETRATHWLLYAGEPLLSEATSCLRQSLPSEVASRLQVGTRREAASRRVAAQRAASPPHWLRNALPPVQ
ncbi:hypothetical protein ACF3DV_05185 [Chlorogloeopsis fritschii PCC 9212]|uniref:hypothetical protein n=1 Tax=Chlorogloeopsis fritschii TaxID=1124 RepID=UPI00190F26DF|nr:hypothetical protein [Chlorogloeopsis fritschii]